MLGMLNAGAPIAGAIFGGQSLPHVEHGRVGAISDRMYSDLRSRSISVSHGLIMLAGLTPLVATLIASRTTFQSTVSEAVLLVCALIGVTLGRALMYSQGTNLSRF